MNISQVDDLSPLAGAPLKRLFAAHTKVTDLKPVGNAPIEWLAIEGTPIEDLTPLLSMPLQMLEIDNPKQHAALLRKIPTVKTINHKPIAEVLGDAIEPTDPDRRAAEWVLSLGGTVEIDVRQGGVKDIADLPKDRFTVTHVSVVYNPAVTDSSLENLGGLQGVKWLNLGGTSVTDEGLIRLKEHKGLTHLVLGRLKLTKTGLAHLKDLKELQMLHFADVPLTDEGLAHLQVLKGLTFLGIKETKVTAKGLADFHAAVPGCKVEHDDAIGAAKK